MCDAACVPFDGLPVITCDKDHDPAEDPWHSAALPLPEDEPDRINWRSDHADNPNAFHPFRTL